MTQFGCCLSIASFVPQANSAQPEPSDILGQLEAGISLLSAIGYDFVELTVGTLNALSEEQFEVAKHIIERSSLKVPVLNSFIPPSLALTGPDVSLESIEAYLKLAMQRVSGIGGQNIIFGSGAARRVPEGFSMDKAQEQIRDFLQLCEKYAAEYQVIVAIEPLNKRETNLIHTVGEALDLAESLKLPHIQVLADTYHMDLEKESYDILDRAVELNLLAHVHIADQDRFFPGIMQNGVDFGSFFSELKKNGYKGRISAECRRDNFAEHSAQSLEFVRRLWQSV